VKLVSFSVVAVNVLDSTIKIYISFSVVAVNVLDSTIKIYNEVSKFTLADTTRAKYGEA